VHYFVAGGWGWAFASFRRDATASGARVGSVVTVPVWLLCVVAALILTALGVAAFVASARLRKRKAQVAPLTKAEILGITESRIIQ
jgi:uncharacterized membrane protein